VKNSREDYISGTFDDKPVVKIVVFLSLMIEMQKQGI